MPSLRDAISTGWFQWLWDRCPDPVSQTAQPCCSINSLGLGKMLEGSLHGQKATMLVEGIFWIEPSASSMHKSAFAFWFSGYFAPVSLGCPGMSSEQGTEFLSTLWDHSLKALCCPL
uniref:Uncharacterized protein n=1 Tax=Sphaerodactylus townsendi TaxID=933632 RepID=A0ACB8FXA2_9SAUR